MFWPLNLKLGTQLTTYAAIALGATAAVDWLRTDARNDERAVIAAEYAKQNADLKDEVARRVKKSEDLQRILQATELEAARLADENKQHLEKQRETVPLSQACTACRIPNERLWLRRPGIKAAPAGAKGGGSS